MDTPTPSGSDRHFSPSSCASSSTDARTKSHRPLAVSLLCCFLLFGVAATAIKVLPNIHEYEAWFRFFVSVSMVITLVASVGMWRMQPWGVYLYGSFVLLAVLVASYLDEINLLAIGVRLAVFALAFHFICRRARHEAFLVE